MSELPSLLGIGRNKVYDLVNSGQLGSIKVGHTRLVPVHALEKFLAVQDA